MAGNNYTVPFAALVDGLHDNVLPQGDPLRFPAPKSTSVQAVVGDVASRTPVKIARRCRLYALPETVWPLVDDGELPLRQAEIIAGLAGVEALWRERVEELTELARRLEKGMEERVSGELVGLDARKKSCSSCGQTVTKGEIEGVLERVREGLDG